MSNLWSPHDIEVLLFLHCRPSNTPWPNGDTPAWRGSKEKLHRYDLIDRTDFPSVTDKGRALIDMWCSQPVPVAMFVDPRLQNSGGLFE